MLCKVTSIVANIRTKRKSKKVVKKSMGMPRQLKGKRIMGTSKQLSAGTVAPYSLGGLNNG